MSTEHLKTTQSIRKRVERSERVLDDLERDLQGVDNELEELAKQNQQYEVLEKVCSSLEELSGLDAAHLFWNTLEGSEKTAEHLENARLNIEQFHEEVARVEERREAIVEKIAGQNADLDYLHYDLQDAIAVSESRKSEWVVEREAEDFPYHAQVMPWARGGEEDERFRKSLYSSLGTALLLMLLLSIITLPIVERATVDKLPERMAKLVREERLPPPPPPEPIEEQTEPDEETPEEEPELADEEVPDEITPDAAEQPAVAEAAPEETREKVKSKGILAFRDSFANRANLAPSAQLGSQARVTSAGEDSIGRPERSMVTSNAPGSSGGINLSNISRGVGGGGGKGIGGVQVSRVASSIGGGGGGGADRPLSGGASAGRTDEEIQIVFDRYKAALYRLYNRELRKDPTLRGQMILRLTIEPDGSVSLCELESSDMKAPDLVQQVVARVSTFDFGAKEDVVAITIIYPIDFLPAA